MNLEVSVFQLLKDVGIKAGHIVLDFGCGSGTYTLPAARIAGDKGKVYALDKDSKVLNKLMQKAQSAGLNNIERMDVHGELEISLAEGSVDVVLLFDVLHPYYFPRPEDRRKLLDEVHRICRADALVLVYPKHMELTAKEEIEKASFHLKSELQGTLVHNGKDSVQGQVLIFGKEQDGGVGAGK
jgi:ubiquinone/menaquinone biosynthesis C-methylase UbiE